MCEMLKKAYQRRQGRRWSDERLGGSPGSHWWRWPIDWITSLIFFLLFGYEARGNNNCQTLIEIWTKPATNGICSEVNGSVELSIRIINCDAADLKTLDMDGGRKWTFCPLCFLHLMHSVCRIFDYDKPSIRNTSLICSPFRVKCFEIMEKKFLTLA